MASVVGKLILDAWSALSHKQIIESPTHSAGQFGAPLAPTWVGVENRRRLTAYNVLAAYRENVARWYIRTSSEEQRNLRREYGDADLLVRQVAASVLGRDVRVAVDGALDSTSGPEHDRQEEIADWLTSEQVWLKMLKAEQDCLALGDTVWWLTTSERKKRVRIRSLDPGFYFPVYTQDDDAEDFPSRVHLAWEFEQWETARRGYVPYVRRITYELRDVPAYRVKYQDEPVNQECFVTDATWSLSDLQLDIQDTGPDGFLPTRAIYRSNERGEEMRDLAMGIDFIPVIHIPNFGGEPWGRSLITTGAQIINDLQGADTDAAEAADVAGAPPIIISGADSGTTLNSYGPKTAYAVPTGGGASVLDTSKGLTSLHDHTDRLIKRLLTNLRVPREILGIVGAAEAPSGTALNLAFNPFKALVGEIRLSRDHKYELLFKQVQRLMVTFGWWEGSVQPAFLEFGAALPEDIAGIVALVKELAGADRPLLSRTTALEILADSGFPGVDDPAEELDRILPEDFDAARLIQVATHSSELAADHLGLELPDYELAAMQQDPYLTIGSRTDLPTDGPGGTTVTPPASNAGQGIGQSDTVTGVRTTPNAGAGTRTGTGAATGSRNPGVRKAANANPNQRQPGSQSSAGGSDAPAQGRRRGTRGGRRRRR